MNALKILWFCAAVSLVLNALLVAAESVDPVNRRGKKLTKRSPRPPNQPWLTKEDHEMRRFRRNSPGPAYEKKPYWWQLGKLTKRSPRPNQQWLTKEDDEMRRFRRNSPKSAYEKKPYLKQLGLTKGDDEKRRFRRNSPGPGYQRPYWFERRKGR